MNEWSGVETALRWARRGSAQAAVCRGPGSAIASDHPLRAPTDAGEAATRFRRAQCEIRVSSLDDPCGQYIQYRDWEGNERGRRFGKVAPRDRWRRDSG